MGFESSKPLRDYIKAKRLLDLILIETNPSSNPGDRVPGRLTGVDMEAKRSSDVNVTVRPRTSNRVYKKQWNQATKTLVLQCKELVRICCMWLLYVTIVMS